VRKKSLLLFEIISTLFILTLGVILHFVFEWTNNNVFIGIFSAINESIWEHLKILFFPILITIVIGHFYFKNDIPNYLCIKTKGLLLALAFIVVFYYTYSGILGTHIAIIDICSFVFTTILCEYYTYKKIKLNTPCNNTIAVIILLILVICFTIFTFNPPHIGIFKDPSTGLYGM